MSHKSPLRELFDNQIHAVNYREYSYRSARNLQSAVQRMAYTVNYPISSTCSGDVVTFGPRGWRDMQPATDEPLKPVVVVSGQARMRYFADLGSHNVDVSGKTAGEIQSLRVLFYLECKRKGYAGHSRVSGNALLLSSVIRPAVLRDRCAKIRRDRIDSEPVTGKQTVSEVDRVFSRWIRTTPGSDEALLWSGKLLRAVRAPIKI